MGCSIDLANVFPDDVYFVVGGTANPKVNGGTAVVQNDQSFTIHSFIGWKVRMFRGGVLSYQSNPNTGNSYYDITSITGEFTTSPALQNDEEILCVAYKPS